MSEEKKFIFAVITYNHSKYIVEHLESIKYLVSNYGNGYKFKLVVADDGSKDNTVDLIKFWISKNSNLFFEIAIEADGVNKGTCVNYTNLWKHIDSELFKVTAGDDVYSFENIIKEADGLKENDFISGLPLLLIDDVIKKSNSTIFHILATDAIYRNKNFMDRLKKIGVINTPSLLYSSKFLKDEGLFDFIREFKVVEDFPMHVRIAETYKNIKFKQTDKVYIYYRRTSGSIYLVQGLKFDKDKVKVFNHMLKIESSYVGKILMRNRVSCYQSNSYVYKMFFNLNYYGYLANVVFNTLRLVNNYFKVKINEDLHKAHYLYLQKESRKYI